MLCGSVLHGCARYNVVCNKWREISHLCLFLVDRRLVLVPPATLLEPMHLFGNVEHGWDLMYDGTLDDVRFQTWEAIMSPGNGVSRDIVSIDTPNVVERLRNSSAKLLVLKQWEIAGRPIYDGQSLLDMVEPLQVKGVACPPYLSKYIIALGRRVRDHLGNKYATVHVRRGDAVSESKSLYLQWTHDEIRRATQPSHIRDVLQQLGAEPTEPVLVFSNEQNASFFDELKQWYPQIVLEEEMIEIAASRSVGYGNHFKAARERSYVTSGLLRRQLSVYLTHYGHLTVCTAATRLGKDCDAKLVDSI